MIFCAIVLTLNWGNVAKAVHLRSIIKWLSRLDSARRPLVADPI